jgi:hypothetical protein
MRAFLSYACFAVAAVWLALAVFVWRNGLAIGSQKGTIDQATLLVILRIAFPTILFGWVVPAAIGVWLFWKRK